MAHECPWCLAERGEKPEAGRHEVCDLHALAVLRTCGLAVVTPHERDRYLTVRDLAVQTNMSEDYWRGRIKDGLIEHVDFGGVKHGGDKRVSVAAFRKYCDERRKGVSA